MAVHFTDSPAADPAVAPDIGALVWPQLRSTAHAKVTVDARLLRVLARALTNGVTAVALRRFLLANSDEPPLVAAVANTPRWHRLVSSSRRHIARGTGSAAGLERHRLEVTRRWVARATQPLEHRRFTWSQEVNARAALSVIARQYLELGFDKIVITAPWLAARLGFSRPHAHNVLALLENRLHWLSRDGKRSGAIRWRLTQLDTDELRDRAWLHGDTVDALATGRYADTALAAALASADSPAWHYAQDAEGGKVLGLKSWVALVHAHAGLSTEAGDGLGLVPARLRRERRELEAHLPGALAGTIDLAEALADVAEFTGANDRRADRDLQAAAEAQANRERVAQFQKAKAAKFELGKAVRRQFRAAHHIDGPLGPPPVQVADLQSWTSRSAKFWNACAGAGLVEPAGIPVARELLVTSIVDLGHGRDLAVKAAAFVFRDEGTA